MTNRNYEKARVHMMLTREERRNEFIGFALLALSSLITAAAIIALVWWVW